MIFKRLIAFLFDIFVVVFISNTLSMTPLNPHYDDFVDLQTEILSKVEAFEEKIEDRNEEVEAQEKEAFSIYYKETVQELNQLSVISDVIIITVVLLYFVVFAFFFGGETVGLRLVRLKIVDKKNRRPSMWRLFFRISILYLLPFTVLNSIACYVLDASSYATFSSRCYLITNGLMWLMPLMVLFTHKNRGLQDIIAGTNVVEVERK